MRTYTIPVECHKKYRKAIARIMGSAFDIDENGKTATGSYDSDKDFDELEDFLMYSEIPFDRLIDVWEEGAAFFRIYRPDRPGNAYDCERQVLNESKDHIAISLKEIKDILDSQESEADKIFTLECFIKSRDFPQHTRIEDISK